MNYSLYPGGGVARKYRSNLNVVSGGNKGVINKESEKENKFPYTYNYDFEAPYESQSQKRRRIRISSSLQLRNYEDIFSILLKVGYDPAVVCRSGHKIKTKKIKFYVKGFENACRSAELPVEYCPGCKEEEPHGPAYVFITIDGVPVAL
jgi:hypothetical protein